MPSPIPTDNDKIAPQPDAVPLIIDGTEVFPPDTFDVVNPGGRVYRRKGFRIMESDDTCTSPRRLSRRDVFLAETSFSPPPP
ncbi:hypothetical protein ACHAPJ_012366 [Fusarium lateritium]